jgi:hemolysin activation/secretion protein
MQVTGSRWACAAFMVIAWAHGAVAQETPAPVEAGNPEERRVDLLNYRVEGNTVLSRLEVEKAVYPFLGPRRLAADVEAARAALEKAYREKGYETVGVEIPEQDVRDGLIRLTVVELKVGRLRVTDARHFSPEDIKKRAPALAEGQVPNYAAVSKQVADLNKTNGDRTITPTLRAGDTPGTVDVDLQVEDALPLHGSLELNDRSSSRTERLRVSGSVRYTNLFQREHSLSLQGQFAPEDPDQTWLVTGSYAAPIQGTPFTVVAYAVHSDSDVAAVGGINVVGSGDIFGLRGIYSFGSGGLFHTLTAGIDYKNFKEDLIVGPEYGHTPIDYYPLTLQYGMISRAEKADVDVTVALNVGLRGLDADEAEFRFKRYNATASWAYLRGDASYLRRLPWGMRASLKLSGQYAGQPLISNEQFSAGGLDSVRGYYESQELGDDGVSGQFDLESPSIHRWTGGLVDEWRFFAFADAAYLKIYDPLADANGAVDDSSSLASVGIGMRQRLLHRLNLSALLAAPLKNKQSTIIDYGDDWRGQFRVWLDF